jgi:hypothetical protein
MHWRRNHVVLISASVVAMVVLAALSAGVASAAEWSVENGINHEGTEVKGLQTLKTLDWNNIQIGAKESKAKEEFILRGNVGKVKFVLKATEVVAESLFISQGGVGSGKLTLKGLTVAEPEPGVCKPPASITTEQLKFELVAVPGLISGTALKFTPQKAGITLLASVEFTGACSGIGGAPISVTTTNGLFGETAAKKTIAADQPVEFTPGINSTSGGNLFASGNAAELTGKVEFKLTGEKNAGKEWAASE